MSDKAKFNVLWSAPARADLAAIADYIDVQDGPDAALAIIDKIEITASKLRTVPKRGRFVPELADLRIRRYRELICRPWRIIYVVEAKLVIVHAVIDARRNVEDILLERFTR